MSWWYPIPKEEELDHQSIVKAKEQSKPQQPVHQNTNLGPFRTTTPSQCEIYLVKAVTIKHHFCYKMPQIDLNMTLNCIHFIKIGFVLSFTGHIINKMTTLVVFLLYIHISLSHSQNLGLTESDYEEEKATSELSDGPPLNSEQWIHSVIFEPLPKVKLTRSSYQVTTFLDFLLFLRGFEKVSDYIEQFKRDLDNPDYTHLIPMRIDNVEIALQNDMEMSQIT